MRTLATLFLLLIAPFVAAQTTKPATANDVALVRELLAVSGAEQGYEQILTIMLGGVRNGFNQGFANALRSKNLDPAKRERAQAIAERHIDEMQKDMLAEIQKVMPYDKLVNEVYAPLYLQNFSRAELQEAIAFYRTPTGRKFATSAPKLMQDASQTLNQRYMPELTRSMSGRIESRMKTMVDELTRL